jgi:uncharacterized small protein (DUF1192 family)
MAKKASHSINRQRLNNMMKHLLKTIRLFASQGHPNVCYNAQFFKSGKKQNPITKGEIETFSDNIRSFITSEEADTVRIEFIDEDTGKTFYTKVLDELTLEGANDPEEEVKPTPVAAATQNSSSFNGFGEAQVREMNDIIGRRLSEERRNDEFTRMSQEVTELRDRAAALEAEKEELEASLHAKKQLEFYSGIIGAAFPKLAPLFVGTPLAQAAGFLNGTNDLTGAPVAQAAPRAPNDEASSIASLVSEFCETLNTQEASAIHLMFMAFEADRSKIQSALHYITIGGTAQPL